jgi:hypothetical protein
MLAIFVLRLEAARVPEISRRQRSPSQPQFLAVTRSTPAPEQPVPARIQHSGAPEQLRPQLFDLFVFVIETLKLGPRLLVKT